MTIPMPDIPGEPQLNVNPDGSTNPYMAAGPKGDSIPYYGIAPDGSAVPPEYMRTTGRGDPIPHLGATGVGDVIQYPVPPGGNPFSVNHQMQRAQGNLADAAEHAYHARRGTQSASLPQTPRVGQILPDGARVVSEPFVTLGGERVYLRDLDVRGNVRPGPAQPSDRHLVDVADAVTRARQSNNAENLQGVIKLLLRQGRSMTPDELTKVRAFIDSQEG